MIATALIAEDELLLAENLRAELATAWPALEIAAHAANGMAAVELALFRIAQEALTNIARHSEATAASVSLRVQGEVVRLEVDDNGHGLKPETGDKSPSLGMVGMRARARQLDGELTVENRKEGGLRIRVEVPLQEVDPNGKQEDSSLVS